jgi:predicted nuclease of predicted toxin-antitoxin system
MKFLLAAELPPRLAKALVRKGHVAWHVADCGLLTAKDRDIWRFAMQEGAALITKDADFAALRISAPNGPPVVWLRLGNIGNDALEKALFSALREISAAGEAKESVVEIG